MGADGGLCWIKIKDRKTYNELTSWFSWSYLNRSAYAYRGEFAKEPEPDDIFLEGDWEEGAYGTDTDYDLEWLLIFSEWCSSDELCQFDYIRDWSFQTLIDSLLTEPIGIKNIHIEYTDPYCWNENYYDCLGALGECLLLHIESIENKDVVETEQGGTAYAWPGPFDKEMTIKEWGKKMQESIFLMSYMSEQTWT